MPPVARALLRVIALSGCALLAILTIPDHSPTLLWKWPRPVFLQLLMVLPVAWVLVAAVAARESRPSLGTIAPAGLAVFAVAAIAAAISGPFPAFSIEVLPLWIAPLFLILAVGYATADPETGETSSRTIASTIAGGLAGLCLISLLWWFLADVLAGWLRADDVSFFRFVGIRNERPLGHSNYTAGVALLALGWCGGLACLAAGRQRKLWIGGVAISLATLFSSGSRGAWIGLAALGATAVWLRMVRRGANRRRIIAGVATVALATVVLAFAHPRTRALINDLRETGGLNSGDVQRYSMIEAGIRMLGERPVLGHGPGATPLVYPLHRADLAGGVETALQLHNTPLQIVADTGLVGLGAAALLAWLVVVRLRHESRKPKLTVAACAAVAFIAYAVFSITDFQLDIPVLGAAFAATLALALTGGAPSRVPAAMMMSLAIAWLFLVAWTQRGLLSERARFSGAIDALERADFAEFRRKAFAGSGTTGPSAPILNSAALIIAAPASYGVQAPAEFAQAADLLRASLGKNPDQELAHFNLGWLLLQSDPAGAAGHFREAARLVPDKGGVYLGLSSALLAQGRSDDALKALAAELVNDPAFCVSPLWSTAGFEPARVATLLIAAAELDGLAADGQRTAAYLAALFRALAGEDAQIPVAQGLSPGAARELLGRITRASEWREEFMPPIETARRLRRQRTAYPLLMRNADIPTPVDLHIVIDDPATRTRLSPLFPSKGWLSGPELRRLGAGIPE